MRQRGPGWESVGAGPVEQQVGVVLGAGDIAAEL